MFLMMNQIQVTYFLFGISTTGELLPTSTLSFTKQLLPHLSVSSKVKIDRKLVFIYFPVFSLTNHNSFAVVISLCCHIMHTKVAISFKIFENPRST